ncbi:MAG: type 4a pilus biogenesis protein PilO [Granulosicoccus sp.]|nr:type 4a pilus biogenesis protein PilO [Granulosicoccus sp.]
MAFSDTLAELKNIDGEDFKRIGTAPFLLRWFLILIGCAVVIGGMSHLMIKPQFDKLKVVQAKELDLRRLFDSEQAKAANRTAYIEQLEEMKKTFSVMLRQLPNKTDIESLLVDLSQTSVASGLEVEYFKPESELPREFYAEYPIRISVTGQYHQFGQFISGLAALPRIVTLSDINISELRDKNNRNPSNLATRLKMDLMATTYRYIEEDE